jgi:hypothetical protein
MGSFYGSGGPKGYTQRVSPWDRDGSRCRVSGGNAIERRRSLTGCSSVICVGVGATLSLGYTSGSVFLRIRFPALGCGMLGRY